MKTTHSLRRQIGFAIAQLKERLISRYERIAPECSSSIRDAIAAAESQAWETPFPHLFFPDFAALRLAAVIPKLASK